MNPLNKILYLTIFAFCFNLTLQSLEINPCYVKDGEKHQRNKEILASIIQEELSTLNVTSDEKSRYLSNRIDQIARKLICRGFHKEAYQVPQINHQQAASFNCFALWEGASQTVDRIPLTFFIYIWPSEKSSQHYHGGSYHSYQSNIHSHPISCALSVLCGSLTQRCFSRTDPQNKVVKMVRTDIFNEGEGDIDDLKQPFVHQLCNKDHEPMTLSLHAYGLASAEQVMNCFRETFAECSFITQ